MTTSSSSPRLIGMKALRILIALFPFLICLALPLSSRAAAKEQAIRFPNGTTIRAEVADTQETQRMGLMFRDRLPEGGGMLFVFQEARPYAFWMKNCKFSIDIIWLNTEKETVYFSERTPPCRSDPCPSYGPKDKAALYVIEVAAGFVKEAGLTLGVPIHFE